MTTIKIEIPNDDPLGGVGDTFGPTQLLVVQQHPEKPEVVFEQELDRPVILNIVFFFLGVFSSYRKNRRQMLYHRCRESKYSWMN